MKRFNIEIDTCNIGFHNTIRINLCKPVNDETLNRRRSYFSAMDYNRLMRIIYENSSLRINFGWSFESAYHYEQIMNDCENDVFPKFPKQKDMMITDPTCSWLGFVPHNFYDKEEYKNLSIYDMIIFNNELIDFQIEVVKFITNHRIFKQHAIIRDDVFRFNYFRNIRKDRDALEEGYQLLVDSVIDIHEVSTIPQRLVEESIGCHFLHNPDLFFELTEFSILKGRVTNE